jgi:hypothetical protein
MIPNHVTQIIFHPLRGGRFSATISSKVARQFADAVMTMAVADEAPRFEKASLKARLVSGQSVSQGDLLSLLRFRPHLQNLGAEALSVLEQVERYVRERSESNGKRSGALRNPFHPIFVLPPRPASTDA